jgi:transcriptional regulator with XRE-family HTH domain
MLEKWQIERDGRVWHVLGMIDDTFRRRFLTALERSHMSVAELARKSGVNYHTIDKFKKGLTVSTSADNARKLALALGMDVNNSEDANRLLALFLSMPPDKQRLLLAMAEAMALAKV